MTRLATFGKLLALIFVIIAGPWCASSAMAENISEVRYIGLGSLNSRELESSIPFAPGDQWRPDFIGRTEKSLLEYYAKRGFYQAKIKVSPELSVDKKTVALVVRVEEGPPCVIEKVWVDDPTGFKSVHVMQRFKDDVVGLLRVNVGDRYDEQTIADHLRELREWLVGKNFILANTDRVRLTFSPDRTRVEVVFAVDYGDRVTFGFQGNSVFTRGELDDFIAQVRATGLGKDYIGVIQRKFVEEYRNRAYNNVKIENKVADQALSKHVTFVIVEDVRTDITEVKWEGLTEVNAATADDVFHKGVARVVQRGYFVEKDVDKGILLVLEDLKARGFLSSKLIARTIQQQKSPKRTHRVRIVVQISEGEQTSVGKIDIQGFGYFDKEKVLATLGLEENQPFNPFGLEEGVQRLRTLYLAEGFLEFKFTTPEDDIVIFAENNRVANIRLSAREGPRIKIGEIRIRGLEKTREYVVAREITVHSDDWWLGAKVQETDTGLRALGLFSEVKIIPVLSPRGPGYRDMSIELKEAESGAFEIGPGYRYDLGPRAFARLSYNNIWGKNWIGTLSAETNRRIINYQFVEYKLSSTFVEPRFFGTKFVFTVSGSDKLQRFPPNFNAETRQLFTSMEHRVFGWAVVKLMYQIESIRQFGVYFNGVLSDTDNKTLLIGSLVPSVTIDTRDNPFTATRGFLMKASLEYADPRFSAQALSSDAPAYQKWQGSIHKYTSIFKDIVWSNVVSGGFARSNIKGRPIPLIKLFRLGGYSTIRGFTEDQINVDSKAINGTLTFLNVRTQFDIPFIGDLKIAPFLDAGNLYIDGFVTRPFFRVGAGFGFHYMTPIGPINLDWGHKLNAVDGEAPNQIHFSVGLI